MILCATLVPFIGLCPEQVSCIHTKLLIQTFHKTRGGSLIGHFSKVNQTDSPALLPLWESYKHSGSLVETLHLQVVITTHSWYGNN